MKLRGTITNILSLLALSFSLTVVAEFTSLDSAHAYIPNTSTITNRLARNNGRGVYVIEQDVQFRTATDPLVLRERWIIENGETMRLTVTSPKAADAIKFDVVYRSGKRTAPDLAGGVKSQNSPVEFFEPFFHARSGRGFLTSLIRARITPPAIAQEKPRITDLKQVRFQPDPLVRLGRSSGVVTWIFGEPTPADAKKLNPGAWIEQDAFILRRLRFPTDSEVVAGRHSVFLNTIRFPRERTVNWENNSVTIRVVSVKAGGPNASLLDPSSINAQYGKTARLPDHAQIREFYSRFR